MPIVADARLRPPGDPAVEGACRRYDRELFFSDKDRDLLDALHLCRSCPVRVACLGQALDRVEQWGVWGGLSAKARRGLRRRHPQVRSWTKVLALTGGDISRTAVDNAHGVLAVYTSSPSRPGRRPAAAAAVIGAGRAVAIAGVAA